MKNNFQDKVFDELCSEKFLKSLADSSLFDFEPSNPKSCDPFKQFVSVTCAVLIALGFPSQFVLGRFKNKLYEYFD